LDDCLAIFIAIFELRPLKNGRNPRPVNDINLIKYRNA